MYAVKKEWKSFNISLDKLEEQLKADFPEHETNPVFKGSQAYSVLELYFDKPIEGYGKDSEGNVTTESGSDAETIEALWLLIDESHIIATSYVSLTELSGAEKRAREDAATKAWDSLSTEQKKLISGADVTLEDRKQMLLDHPSV